MERHLFCEASDCPHRLIDTQSEGWLYYQTDDEEWHFYHEECFEFNELEVIANE